MSGNTHERDYDEDTGESGWSETWNRGGHDEKEFTGDHGTHYIETTDHRTGQTHRINDDGTVERRS